jgi:hypothetical protein
MHHHTWPTNSLFCSVYQTIKPGKGHRLYIWISANSLAKRIILSLWPNYRQLDESEQPYLKNVSGNMKGWSGMFYLTYSIPATLALLLSSSMLGTLLPQDLCLVFPLTAMSFPLLPHLHAGSLSSLKEMLLWQTTSCPTKIYVLFP